MDSDNITMMVQKDYKFTPFYFKKKQKNKYNDRWGQSSSFYLF